jgi:hypothetical protein
MNVLAEKFLVMPVDQHYSFHHSNQSKRQHMQQIRLPAKMKNIKFSDSLVKGWHIQIHELKQNKFLQTKKYMIVKFKEYNNFMIKQAILKELNK